MKEGTKGFLGISTKVLEEGRGEAVVVNSSLAYPSCYEKVKEVLKKEGSFIYADDAGKRMIAFYFSKEDTTPLGIFFVEEGGGTRLEVTSPSSYSKQVFAEKLSAALSPIK